MHEVSRGSTNVVVLPETLCKPGEMPPPEQPCNQVDCPPVWRHGLWSRCSTDCGKGVKRRTVRCVKELAFGGEGEVPETECSTRKKPRGIKVCKASHCRYDVSSSSSLRDPLNRSNGTNTTTTELSRKSKRNHSSLPSGSVDHHLSKQVTVKVAGKATVVEGSTVKLRCPEWRKRGLSAAKDPQLYQEEAELLLASLQGPRVHWSKGNERLVGGGRRHHLVRNFLKIKNIKVSDSAVYKCWTEDRETDEHSMFLYVRSKQQDGSGKDKSLLSEHSGGNGLTEMSDRESSGLLKKSHNNKVVYYKSELDLSEEAHSRYRGSAAADYLINSLPVQKTKNEHPSSPERGAPVYKSEPSPPHHHSNVIADSESSWELTAQERLPPSHQHHQFHHQNQKTTSPKPLPPNLPSLNKIDGDRIVSVDDDEEAAEKSQMHIPLSQLLREGTFAWITSDWSKCTIPCGGIGFRVSLKFLKLKI